MVQRRLIVWLVSALVLGCRSAPHEQSAPPPPSSSSAPAFPWRVERASFETSAVDLDVADAHMSRQLDGPFATPGALAVFNSAFFDERHEPLGLVIAHGRSKSRFAPAMIGGVFWVKDGVAHLTASEEYEVDAGAVDFALQCKPRLVVDGKRNIRSDDGKRAARTVLCLRDAGARFELYLITSPRDAHDGPTLFETADELVRQGCDGALALDGGPSTAGVLQLGQVRVEPRGPIRQAVIVRAKP